jgi:ABC-type spermidine/putrescine transport system permease subunit II
VALEGVTRRFGEVTAVDDLSLALTPGEFVTLLGPSGCGKTTALRLLAGFEQADKGTLRFRGDDITRWTPQRRGFGMVFQNYALFPHLNVFENVAFGLKSRKSPPPDLPARVDAALARVDLAGYAEARGAGPLRRAAAAGGPGPGAGRLRDPPLARPLPPPLRGGDSVWIEGASRSRVPDLLPSRAELEALWGSLWISAGSVILSALLGVPLAFLFTRFDFPGRTVFGALAALPVLLPPLVGVIAFLFLYGESGIFTRTVQLVLGLERPPWRLTGGWAILLVHAYSMYVYFYLFTAAGLARLDASAGEAAESLGGRARIFFRVTLPMLAPSLGAASVLVFMTSMASFSAPYIFGGGFRVLTTQIFTSKMNGELTMAMVETVVLATASLLFLWPFTGRFERGRAFAAVGKGTPAARREVKGRWARILIPLAGWGGGVPPPSPPHAGARLVRARGGVDHPDPSEPLHAGQLPPALLEPPALDPGLNSLQMATLATAGNLVFCFLIAYLVVRGASGEGGRSSS